MSLIIKYNIKLPYRHRTENMLPLASWILSEERKRLNVNIFGESLSHISQCIFLQYNIGSLKLAMIGVFTIQKLANATNQVFPQGSTYC